MCSLPGANASAKLRGYWTKLNQIFIRSRVVNARIHVAIIPSVMDGHRIWIPTEWRWVCQFSQIRHARPLRDREKIRLIMATHICTYPENMVKRGPAHRDSLGHKTYFLVHKHSVFTKVAECLLNGVVVSRPDMACKKVHVMPMLLPFIVFFNGPLKDQ